MINFCFDYLLTDRSDYPWPNLVEPVGNLSDADLYEHRGSMSNLYPRIDFPRIIDYLRDEQVEHRLFCTDVAPNGSLYLVNVCWFDHTVDYFARMPAISLDRLKKGEIKFVFIYCESDSALSIQRSIFRLCRIHQVNPVNVFVALGNSFSDLVPNFYHFNDAEILFRRSQEGNFLEKLHWHDQPRSKKMTLLSRVHKSWRAYFCSWVWKHGFHHDSYFSYRMIDQGEDMNPNHNPLNSTIKGDPEYQQVVDEFLSHAPFSADQLTDRDHNLFGSRVDEHFQNSYWNCILETHLSLHENMPGTLVSEKTWKVIAHGQPFIILGTPGSLDYLRDQGYRTFSEIDLPENIDESYDYILDPTERFKAVFKQVQKIHSLSYAQLSKLNLAVKDIVEHNQQVYWANKKERLESLFNKIQNN